MIKQKKGVALISVLAVSAIVLIVISSSTVISIVDSKMSFSDKQSQKAYQGAKAVSEEAVLRFIRQRVFTNPYPVWSDDCLQIEDFSCKMDLNLQEDGGYIDVWGKTGSKIRHLQVELSVVDNQVQVIDFKEVF